MSCQEQVLFNEMMIASALY